MDVQSVWERELSIPGPLPLRKCSAPRYPNCSGGIGTHFRAPQYQVPRATMVSGGLEALHSRDFRLGFRYWGGAIVPFGAVGSQVQVSGNAPPPMVAAGALAVDRGGARASRGWAFDVRPSPHGPPRYMPPPLVVVPPPTAAPMMPVVVPSPPPGAAVMMLPPPMTGRWH